MSAANKVVGSPEGLRRIRRGWGRTLRLAVKKQGGLATVMERTTFAVVSGLHKQAKLLAAQRLRREMTPAEKALWYHLRGNRLGGRHFRRQQVIGGFIADFYCHGAALAIELDGPVHAAQADYDAERDRIIQERGIRVLRFANAQVLRDRPGVLARIQAAMQQPPVPLLILPLREDPAQ